MKVSKDSFKKAIEAMAGAADGMRLQILSDGSVDTWHNTYAYKNDNVVYEVENYTFRESLIDWGLLNDSECLIDDDEKVNDFIGNFISQLEGCSYEEI